VEGVAAARTKSRGMTEHEASRTLVKSPPELWAECSDAESLARHLNGSFGEIRITRLEPETAVAWEGELASGTVRLEPSGWGTKVILTARPEAVAEPAPAGPVAPEVVAEPEPVVKPEPVLAAEPLTEPDPGPIAGPEPVADPEPEPVAAVEPFAGPTAAPPKRGFFKRIRAMFAVDPLADKSIVLTPVVQEEPDPPVEAVAPPEPEPPVEAVSPPEPEPVSPEPVSPPEPQPIDTSATDALAAVLDSLGQAHHRPFSRS
jgi:hypothetical protein